MPIVYDKLFALLKEKGYTTYRKKRFSFLFFQVEGGEGDRERVRV